VTFFDISGNRHVLFPRCSQPGKDVVMVDFVAFFVLAFFSMADYSFANAPAAVDMSI